MASPTASQAPGAANNDLIPPTTQVTVSIPIGSVPFSCTIERPVLKQRTRPCPSLSRVPFSQQFSVYIPPPVYAYVPPTSFYPYVPPPSFYTHIPPTPCPPPPRTTTPLPSQLGSGRMNLPRTPLPAAIRITHPDTHEELRFGPDAQDSKENLQSGPNLVARSSMYGDGIGEIPLSTVGLTGSRTDKSMEPANTVAEANVMMESRVSDDGILNSGITRPEENLKGEDEPVNHSDAGFVTSLPESHVAESAASRKVKSKELSAPTSDLYHAYKGPEEKKELVTSTEVFDSGSSSLEQVSTHVSHAESSNENASHIKEDHEDREDAPEIPTPKPKASHSRNQVLGSGEGGIGVAKKNSRNILHIFAEQCTALPVATLNKRTPENIEELFEQMKQIINDNVDTLKGVYSQFYGKESMGPMLCEMFAGLSHRLEQELPGLSANTFLRLMYKRQEEFEIAEREKASKADNEGKVKLTEEEREKTTRARNLANIELIGELYKKGMLTKTIMHDCIKKLLLEYLNPDEEDVKLLCTLMSTIGEMIDHPKAKEPVARTPGMGSSVEDCEFDADEMDAFADEKDAFADEKDAFADGMDVCSLHQDV